MKELSLHILDITKNSTQAQASEVCIEIQEDLRANVMTITISDDGSGMSKEVLETITNPFSTSRTTRRVGMGLSLWQLAAEQSGGEMTIESEEGKGTTVVARFQHDHIDRMPLGDISFTLMTLLTGHPDVEFRYTHQVNDTLFELYTKDVKQELGELPISDVSVVNFLSEYVQNHIRDLYN